MTCRCAKVSARQSSSLARGIAAAMVVESSTLRMTYPAWLAALVPTSKVRATLFFAFDRWTRTFPTTLHERLVPTARQHSFDIKLAVNRGKG